MAKVYSFSVPDNESQLIAILDELKSRKALSMELVRILKVFFLNHDFNREAISKEYLKLLETEKLAKEALEKAQQALKEIEDLKPIIEKKQEEKEIEDNLHLIRELREIVFEDLQDYKRFESSCKRIGKEPKDAIKVRLSSWAVEKQIPLPQAVKLFFKAFPELRELKI